jgi:hypothetical protein
MTLCPHPHPNPQPSSHPSHPHPKPWPPLLDRSTAAKARKILGEYASKALQRLGMQDDNAAVGCRHDGVFVRMVLYLRRGCWEEDDGQLASDVSAAP